MIVVPNKAQFSIELSVEGRKFYIVVKRKMLYTTESRPKLFYKQLFVMQAKQLLRLFDDNLHRMINSMIKITKDFIVDFSFIDKVLMHMVGLKKEALLEALKIDYVEYYPPIKSH